MFNGLVVTGINGQTERLVGHTNVRRKWRVNGDHSLSFDLLNVEEGKHSYFLADKRAKITDRFGDEYIIRSISKPGHRKKSLQAIHIFLDDLLQTMQHGVLNGYTNFVQAITFVFQNTGWTWINQGAFASTRFENFGKKNSLALFQEVLNRYQAEFQIDNKNKQIIFKNEIGNYTEAQFRHGHNLITFNEDTDMNNFSTVIRGTGKAPDGSDIVVDYRSPMADVYGELPQDPFEDDRFNSVESVTDECKVRINDVPDTKFGVSVANLIENGLKLHNYDYGDYVYMLYEQADVKVRIRIVEMTDDPTNEKISPVVELSTFKQLKTMAAIQAQFQQTQKQVKDLMDENGNLSMRLKKLYANTNVFTDHTGMWMIDPDDPNRYAHHGSGGSDYHRGMLRVERPDGAAWIQDGISRNNLVIQPTHTPFLGENVTVRNRYARTTVQTWEFYGAYDANHEGRYMRVAGYGQVSLGDLGIAVESYGGEVSFYQVMTVPHAPGDTEGKYFEMIIDLGVPTYAEMHFYVKFRSIDVNPEVGLRVNRIIQFG